MHQATILLVDDDHDTRELLATWLEQAGYRVAQHSTGEAALVALDGEPFDLLVASIHMKPVHALHLLRHVRQAALPLNVIVMTPYPSRETAVQAQADGAFDYLILPFVPAEFMARVQDALGAPPGTVSFELGPIEREFERYPWFTRKRAT
ncbi:MAG: response regulator [Anaerolineae bacterium]|nr:response regulator [Anaerolineae bacterium]